MAPVKVIEAEHIPPPFNGSSDVKEDFRSTLSFRSFKEAKSEFEKGFIEAKLREFNGNISQTAEAIGIERSNLHKKIKTYGLERFRSK